MLARDYCGKVGIKLKPVILSHHMLYGLKVFHIVSRGSLAGGLTVWEVKLILGLRRRLRRATPKWGTW
jgi:hypothetical protein